MVLVSLLLVLAAAVALVVGLLQSGLAIIYVSIGCSVVAGVLLAVAVVRGKPDRVSSGPMAQPATLPPPPAPEPAAASPSWQSPQPAVEPEREREPVMAGAGAGLSGSSGETQQLDQAAIELAVRGDDDDKDGPIPGYDRLRATEVLPLLANLDAGELAEVRAQEVAGRNRFMVLSRIDRELEARGPAEPEAAEVGQGEWDSDDDWGGSAEAEAETDDDADLAVERRGEADDEEPATSPDRVAAPAPSSSILENYEQLKVLEILPRLGELNADELAQVRRREQAGQRRAMIINRVDRLIVDARPAPAARPPRAPRPSAPTAPARRGPATKATAKKVTAKKAPVPTPAAAKAPTRKTPAKKLTPARTPAKKAVAKKVAAKKAPAKKVVARTSTPAEKRGAPVRGATKVTKATKKR